MAALVQFAALRRARRRRSRHACLGPVWSGEDPLDPAVDAANSLPPDRSCSLLTSSYGVAYAVTDPAPSGASCVVTKADPPVTTTPSEYPATSTFHSW